MEGVRLVRVVPGSGGFGVSVECGERGGLLSFIFGDLGFLVVRFSCPVNGLRGWFPDTGYAMG